MTFKERIAGGGFTLGTFLKTPSPILVEVLADAGLDCLCLDAEHAPFDRPSIDACVHAARAGGLPVLVRVPVASAEHVLNALDCGADGVLLPHIRSRAEAEAAARACAYGRGGRGYAGSSRAARYGGAGMADHLAASAARTTVIVQIEDVEALDELDAIAAAEGIDALFVGRIDLTVALGAASPDDPSVIAAVDRVLAAGRAAGRAVGMFVPRNEDVPTWRAKGAGLFLQSSEHAFIRQGAAALRRVVEGEI